jgi:hypothetical protein
MTARASKVFMTQDEERRRQREAPAPDMTPEEQARVWEMVAPVMLICIARAGINIAFRRRNRTAPRETNRTGDTSISQDQEL